MLGIPLKKSANNVVEVLLPRQIVNSILIGQYLFDTSLISEKSRSQQKKYGPSSLGASNEPCNSNCQRVVKSLYLNAVFMLHFVISYDRQVFKNIKIFFQQLQ